jgi:hypothetical protein
MEGGAFDVLVIEDQMADGSGTAIAQRLRHYCPDLEVVRMCDAALTGPADDLTVIRPFTAYDLIGAVSDATVYTRRGAITR